MRLLFKRMCAKFGQLNLFCFCCARYCKIDFASYLCFLLTRTQGAIKAFVLCYICG